MNVGMLGYPRKGVYFGTFFQSAAFYNPVVGEHIQFDTRVSGNLKLATGVGQENGIITLPPGYIYFATLNVVTNDSGGDNSLTEVGFYDLVRGDWVLPGPMCTAGYGVNAYFPGANPNTQNALTQLLPITTATKLVARIYSTTMSAAYNIRGHLSIFTVGKI